ncbi:hypothetical protein CDD81_4748 [Ophiocordyceps australis]|uniref:DUF1264 domain-containing protein n=1 Tax=Ophiocordyceps australis TaxID=1399860 RepID=A0A2C5YBC1_9HYPO|nr:hypothetical protein CDD81_4748 [Ophiocordyceps australis]
MAQDPTSNKTPGEPMSMSNTILTSAASMVQEFKPLKNICAHLNAFHVYAKDPKRFIEANHYCAHLNDQVRQCLLYDSDQPGARLIGIEYMITTNLYESLPAEERKLWHSHVYEVKSGMLIMPNPHVPEAAWQPAETSAMEQVVRLYGKVYHLWQTDRGDKLPLGEPQLMTSLTQDGQLDEKELETRDAKFGVDFRKKREARRGIATPEIHPDADQAWKTKGV